MNATPPSIPPTMGPVEDFLCFLGSSLLIAPAGRAVVVLAGWVDELDGKRVDNDTDELVVVIGPPAGFGVAFWVVELEVRRLEEVVVADSEEVEVGGSEDDDSEDVVVGVVVVAGVAAGCNVTRSGGGPFDMTGLAGFPGFLVVDELVIGLIVSTGVEAGVSFSDSDDVP